MSNRLNLLIYLLFTATLYSQIPNSSFENWTGNEPDGWATSNGEPDYVNITKTTDAQSGSFAVRGDVVSIPGGVIGPIIQSGSEGEGFSVNKKYSKVTGYYKFHSVGGDRLGFNFILFKNGQAIAYAVTIAEEAANYTPFEVYFNYEIDETPDTCNLQIILVGPSTGPDYHLGSYFIVDNLALVEGSINVYEASTLPSKYNLSQNYPNPFNPQTVIEYELGTSGWTTITIYNILGKEIGRIVNEFKEAGKHIIAFSADDFNLPSGIYFYQINSNGFIATKKMTFLK